MPLATFERLVRLCLESKRGEYYVKLADEEMSYVSDEKTWMVTDMWRERESKYTSQFTRGGSVRVC